MAPYLCPWARQHPVWSGRATQGLLQPKACFPFLTALRGALLTQEEAFSSHFQFLLVSEGPHKTTCVDKVQTQSYVLPAPKFVC